MAVQWRNLKYMWLVSIVYLIVGGIEAVLAGSIVGLMYVMYRLQGSTRANSNLLIALVLSIRPATSGCRHGFPSSGPLSAFWS